MNLSCPPEYPHDEANERWQDRCDALSKEVDRLKTALERIVMWNGACAVQIAREALQKTDPPEGGRAGE